MGSSKRFWPAVLFQTSPRGWHVGSVQLVLLLLLNQPQIEAVQLPRRYYLQTITCSSEKIALILTAFSRQVKVILHVLTRRVKQEGDHNYQCWPWSSGINGNRCQMWACRCESASSEKHDKTAVCAGPFLLQPEDIIERRSVHLILVKHDIRLKDSITEQQWAGSDRRTSSYVALYTHTDKEQLREVSFTNKLAVMNMALEVWIHLSRGTKQQNISSVWNSKTSCFLNKW